jgi:hypothetical protein
MGFSRRLTQLDASSPLRINPFRSRRGTACPPMRPRVLIPSWIWSRMYDLYHDCTITGANRSSMRTVSLNFARRARKESAKVDRSRKAQGHERWRAGLLREAVTLCQIHYFKERKRSTAKLSLG